MNSQQDLYPELQQDEQQEDKRAKLAVLLLIPLAIIGGAIWLAMNGGDDDTTDTATTAESAQTPTMTVPPIATQESTAPLAVPTAVPAPTPLTISGGNVVVSLPTLTPVSETLPTSTAAPTAPPASSRTGSSGTGGSGSGTTGSGTTGSGSGGTGGSRAVPTPTVDTTLIAISCSSDVPTTLDVGESFGPITAITSPPEAAAGMTFVWNFGNGFTVTAPTAGVTSYADTGDYLVSVVGTVTATGRTISQTCQTVRVGASVAQSLSVTCTVRPSDGTVALRDALPNVDEMLVRVAWTPADVVLDLQYSFDPIDPIVFANGSSSPASQTNTFNSEASIVTVNWQYPETGARGGTSCPVFDPTSTAGPAATATATVVNAVTATPTTVTTAATATATAAAGASPTPTATAGSTAATPTPTAVATGATPTATAVTGATATATAVTQSTATPTAT